MKLKRRRPRFARNHLSFQRLEPRKMLAALANGQEIESSVGVGDSETFEIDIAAGQTVDILVGETFGSSTSPRLTVFAPNGSEIGTDSSSSDASLEFIATQTGTYTAVVEEDGRNRALGFRIRALTLPGTPQLIAGRDQALNNGDEAISSVPVGGLAVFPVDIAAGQSVGISVDETSGSSTSPRLTVFAPNGSEIDTNSTSSGASLEFIATQTGTYTAVVEEDGRNEAFGFSITATGITQLAPEVIRFRRDGQTNESIDLLDRPDTLTIVDLSFNQDVNVSASDFTFFNETTGASVGIPPVIQEQAFLYDATSFTVTFDFTPFLPSFFQPGLYRISAPASSLTAVSDGRPLIEDFSEQILVALPGDANLDGRVDVLTDAFALIGNLGTAGGAAWRDGDFNGDGVVDVLNDAFALVGNLGRDLIPAAASASSSPLLAAASLPVERQSAVIVDTASEEDDDKENFQAASRDTVFAGEQEYLVLA